MKYRPIFLKAERQASGLLFREVEVGWLHGWLIRLLKPRGWWIVEVGWNPECPTEPIVHCSWGRWNLEAVRQVVAWAENGGAPRVIVKNYRDETKARIGKQIVKEKREEKK